MRHAFRILEELGAECDRLGVRVVDVHGESGPASEFLTKIVRYIEARERECDRYTLTDAEREAVDAGVHLCEHAAGEANENVNANAWAATAATLRGVLDRTK